jgi:hypothetical protein
MKVLTIMICAMGMMSLASAENAASPRVSPTDAKNHIGETASVCGKVVDNKVAKYGIAGHGKPVTFDLDQPEPNAQFYFVAFGAEPGGPQEVVSAYQGKRVCVTGKINEAPGGGPFIMAADRAQIQVQPESK